MMNKTLAALAVSSLALATPAFAAGTADTGTVNISGVVGKKCHFTGPTPASITLGELADTTTGKLNDTVVEAATATLTAWCNAAASMAVTANPLKAGTYVAPDSNFDDRIEYTATASISTSAGAKTASDTTDAGLVQAAGTGTSVGIFSSSMGITFTNANTANNGLLVADNYTGSVTVTLTPQ